MTNIFEDYDNMYIIIEQNNNWSLTFAQNIQNIFGDKFTYNVTTIDINNYEQSRTTLINIFNNMTNTDILAPLIMNKTENFVRIVNESNVNKMMMYSGDKIYGFENNEFLTEQELITFASKVNLNIAIFNGFDSIYRQIYKSPFAINLIDVINVIKTTETNKLSDTFETYIGYNGLMTLNNINTRQYGKIVIINYGYENKNEWDVQYIYENDIKLGEVIYIGNKNKYS